MNYERFFFYLGCVLLISGAMGNMITEWPVFITVSKFGYFCIGATMGWWLRGKNNPAP